MKVFISWSGQLSHKVACAFREWLPSVIQSVHPYVSSEDIDKGTRWSTDISKELDESSYGIICVTKDNLNAPWVSFEAGALSKIIDKSNVSPFLFNIKRSDVQGPLLQFQSSIYEHEDVHKLVKSINKRIDESNRLTDDQLRKAFDVWWPELDQSLKDIPDVPTPPKAEADKEAKSSEILEELLELARSQMRLLNDPEAILPPPYLEHVIGQSSRSRMGRDFGDYDHVHQRIIRLEDLLRSKCDDEESDERIMIALSLVKEIHEFFHDLDDSSHRRSLSKRRMLEGRKMLESRRRKEGDAG